MPLAGKANSKATLDAAAWAFNIVTSVGIIMVNKALMATYGFRFGNSLRSLHSRKGLGVIPNSVSLVNLLIIEMKVEIGRFYALGVLILTTTLSGLHFATTTLMTIVLRWTGHIQSSHLPASEILKFAVCGNFSIVGMNVSLMWNTVGFYQIAKLSMIPVSCFLEVVLDKVRYSRDTKLSILLVLLGVAICTVRIWV
ncbi:hypothetical protein C3L33_05873, partial [Rhododendron williamsianum]